MHGHINKIESIIFLKMKKSVYTVYISDYQTENKLGSNIESQGENGINDWEKLNQKILQKQNLIKMKDQINKEYLISASRVK